jgi:hypothetical protein
MAQEHRAIREDRLMRSAIAPVFLALAAWFLFGPRTVDVVLPERAAVARDALTAIPRAAMGHPPTARIGGYDQTCMNCHALFPAAAEPARELRQHAHVMLRHGNNDQCYHCHDREDRDRLRLLNGRVYRFDQSEQLCAQCHGPTYRQWQLGTHGKTIGSWMPEARQRRLTCTECHDPHAPAQPPLKPLPAPRLRFATVASDHDPHHEPPRSPLRRWSRP